MLTLSFLLPCSQTLPNPLLFLLIFSLLFSFKPSILCSPPTISLFFFSYCSVAVNYYHFPSSILHYKHVASLLCPLNTHYVTGLHKRE